MPLQKQLIPISFAEGIDTKTDEKQVLPGRLTTLENGVFSQIGQINKRPGSTILSNNIYPAGTINQAVALATYKDELLAFDGYNIFSYLPDNNTWIDRGSGISAITTNQAVIRNDSEQLNPDMATLSGVQLTAWEDSRNSTGNQTRPVRYSAQDSITGALIVSDAVINQTYDNYTLQPKVIPFQGFFCVIYFNQDSYNLRCAKVSPSTPDLTTDLVIAAATHQAPTLYYDACVVGNRLFVAYKNASNQVSIAYLDSSFVSHDAAITIAQQPNNIALGTDGTNLWIAYQRNSNSNIYAAAYNASTLASVVAETLVVTNPGTLNNLAIATKANTIGYMDLFYEVNANLSFNTLIGTNTITTVAVVGTPSTLIRSAGLAGKPFQFGNIGYLPIAYESQLQSSYFLIRLDNSAIVSKISYGLGGGLRDHYTLAETQNISNGIFTFANCKKSAIIAEAGTLFSLLGINATTIDFLSDSAFINTTLGNNLLITGGVIQSYDGNSFVEHGFHVYPENATFTDVDFSLSVNIIGDATHAETSLVAFSNPNNVSGAYLVPGSYVQWQTTTPTNYAVWWTVDGAGSAPGIPNTTILGPVAILSTDNGTTVASKVQAVITGHSGFTATASGNSVTITNSSNGAVTHGTVTVGSNGIGGGTFQYCATYEWTDNLGNIQRSAPSVPVQLIGNNNFGADGSPSTTYSVGTATVLVNIPTLRLTSKLDPRDKVRITIYRTQANGSLFHRVTSILAPLYNDLTVDTVSFIDSLNDANLISNELLYTTGNVLDNIAPPGASFIITYRNRCFLGGLDDPNTIWFSKVLNDLTNTSTVPVEFSDQLTLSLDARGGAITAFGVLDDKLIIFKETAIFQIAGDGPAATGDNSDYGDPVVLSSNVGCSDPNSVIITPNGLMFKSAYGIYLLDRAGQAQYIGAPIEAYNDRTITSASLVDDQQIIFTSKEDDALVYDYYFDKWSVFTNGSALDSDIFQGNLVYISNSDAHVHQRDTTIFTDNGAAIDMKLTTGWISLAGLQGYQRVYALYLLGTFKSNHTLTVSISYDFVDTVAQTTTFNVTGEPYQFRIFLNQQKCEAIKITIQDTPSAPYGEGFAISALTLEVGTKQGPMRIPPAQSGT